MIKCPHCGSTAQVKLNYDPHLSFADKDILIEGFHCGCGCEWEVEYARNENGHWEIYLIDETCKPKEEKRGHIHCPCNGTDCIYWRDGLCAIYSEEENWTDPYEACDDFALFWEADDDYIDYD